jgi:single-strand DNA-binding protein
MSGHQRTTIVGRLGKDPESRSAQNGSKVCTFPMAVSEGSGDHETTEWFNVVAFDKRAEVCAQYLKKGIQCLIEGRMKTRTWEQDGAKRSRVELIADKIVFLERVEKAGDHGHTGAESLI